MNNSGQGDSLIRLLWLVDKSEGWKIEYVSSSLRCI